MKIWILGATGLVGRTLIEVLKKREIPFVGTSKQEIDITHFAALARFAVQHLITHIVNCAAYTLVDEAESHSMAAHLVNSEGPLYLGNLASRLGIKVVHISSDYVFDGTKKTPYIESDEGSPINVYGRSKWLGEKQLLERLPTACIIRTSWVFGKGGRNFISSLLKWLKEKEELRVVADQRSRPTYCYDLAEAIVHLLDHTGVFHFANKGDTSRFEIALSMKREAEKQGMILACQRIIPIEASTAQWVAPRPYNSLLATEKWQLLVGHSPRSWEEGMKEFIHDS